MTSTFRVYRRFRVSMEFPTQDALKEYLHEHPNANKSLHWVGDQEKGSKPESEDSGSEGKSSPKYLGNFGKLNVHEVLEKFKANFQNSSEKAQKDVSNFKYQPKLKAVMMDEETREYVNYLYRKADFEKGDIPEDLEMYLSVTPQAFRWAKKEYQSMPEEQKVLFSSSRHLDETFQNYLKDSEKSLTETQREYLKQENRKPKVQFLSGPQEESFSNGLRWMLGWRNQFPTIQKFTVGALNRLGIAGSQDKPSGVNSEGRKTPKAVEELSFYEKGQQDPTMEHHFKTVYEFTQAYLKHLGIKEVTLYRGVKSEELGKSPKGSKVKMGLRAVSSFTLDPGVAAHPNFSDGNGGVVKVKVPVENILVGSFGPFGTRSDSFFEHSGSPQTEAVLEEAEFLVMGMDGIEGEVMTDHGRFQE